MYINRIVRVCVCGARGGMKRFGRLCAPDDFAPAVFARAALELTASELVPRARVSPRVQKTRRFPGRKTKLLERISWTSEKNKVPF